MKTYLGDGVYIQTEPGYFILTTENGISVTNEIYLDGEVTHNLIKFIEKFKAASKQEAEDLLK